MERGGKDTEPKKQVGKHSGCEHEEGKVMMNFRPVMGGGEVTARMCQVKSVGRGRGWEKDGSRGGSIRCVQGKPEEFTLYWYASARSHMATSRLLLYLVTFIHSQQIHMFASDQSQCTPILLHTVYNLELRRQLGTGH